MRINRTITEGLLPALLLWPLAAAALTGDRDQPMELEADRAEFQETRGIAIYEGHVEFRQGSIRLWADRLTLYRGEEGVARVVAEGKPARFRQRPEGKDEDVQARAREMEYLAAEDLIILRSDAHLEQAGDVFEGDRIEYDIAGEVVKARGGESSEGRVRMTIQPRSDAAQ